MKTEIKLPERLIADKYSDILRDENGVRVCQCSEGQPEVREIIAAELARRWNCHAAMKEALQNALKPMSEHSDITAENRMAWAMQKIEAALALAEKDKP
jgi:hypothetical protein